MQFVVATVRELRPFSWSTDQTGDDIFAHGPFWLES